MATDPMLANSQGYTHPGFAVHGFPSFSAPAFPMQYPMPNYPIPTPMYASPYGYPFIPQSPAPQAPFMMQNYPIPNYRTMTRNHTDSHSKAYSEDLRWVLVYMHHKRNLSVNRIEKLTGLKPRTIQRVLNLYEGTGKVMPPEAKSARARKLDDNDIDVSVRIISGHILKECPLLQYLKSCIARSAVSYLDELQNHLEDMCHVRVSVSTIWRALKREGFTMKRVRQFYVSFIIIQV
jgi:transposase